MAESLSYPSQWIAQLTTARYPLTGAGFQLTDEAGAPITLTQLTTLTLTIYDLGVTPPEVIPGSWPRDIKNANGGTVSASGLLVLTVPRADNAILISSHAHESRRWVIEWTYQTGTKTKRLEITRVIANTLGVA